MGLSLQRSFIFHGGKTLSLEKPKQPRPGAQATGLGRFFVPKKFILSRKLGRFLNKNLGVKRPFSALFYFSLYHAVRAFEAA